MYLYHGTSVPKAKEILKAGLTPRKYIPGSLGNWSHSVPSALDRVYLTDAYAPYFALCAADDGEPWAIIEVRDFVPHAAHLGKLNEKKFVPDEDYLEQTMRFEGGLPHFSPGDYPDEVKDMRGRTEYFRDNISDFQFLWKESLNRLGTCAYMGTIPPELIHRVSVFDPSKNRTVAVACMDPSISLINYHLMRDKYVALTQWMIGEEITIEDFFGKISLPTMSMLSNKQLGLVADAIHDRSALTFLKE